MIILIHHITAFLPTMLLWPLCASVCVSLALLALLVPVVLVRCLVVGVVQLINVLSDLAAGRTQETYL